MSEIWNLSTLCRCCHADGYFKSLNLSYQSENDVEIYENMLQETLGISISTPPVEASYTICDECIFKLRDATDFKRQVLMCEQKFTVYCKNEQFVVTSDNIKLEENDDGVVDYDDDIQIDEHFPEDVKKEYSIEVDIKHPIEEKVKTENQVHAQEKNLESDINAEETNKKSEVPKKRIRKKTISKEGFTTKGEQRKNRRNIDLTLIIEVDTETGTKYSCKDCGGLYQTHKDITRHLYKQHSTLFKCEHCSKQLKTLNGFKNHLKLHTGKEIQCRYCPKKFAYKSAYKDHLNCHTREKIYQCDICQKDFRYKLTLIRHLWVHEGTNKKILCDHCGKGFNDKSNLNAHIQSVHLKLRPFDCKTCGKTYTNNRHLKDHLKTHNGEVTVYKCDVCDHKLVCEKTMQIHRLRHDHKFMCRFCSKVFDDVNARREHMKDSHTKEQSWLSCSICGKVLLGKYSLNRHMDHHKGIKRFSCDFCELKFSQKAVLNRHVFRKHNPKADINVGKTKCDICKQSFKNIVLHMNCHTKRCGCDLCGKTYADNSALNRHKQQKHYGRTFDCEICGKKYQQKAKLNTHKIKVHKIKIEKVGAEGS
ncbi:hypothetical protein PYW07_011274 [Mythimna separata]|uniref:Uncharacterized protein n=1 Tax=Mythimna separata TaxID=271217 RepID=A0AAD7Y9Q8_MYTSE|nr:hypothetical protein PYW07_011274 [Mythimna separata]